ncbi:hypothetical protein [Streptomyces roseolus]
MGLVDRAGPGVEEQADRVAEAACELADAAAGSGWSTAAADGALVAIGTLTAALAWIDPGVREALIEVAAAASTVRRRACPSTPDWSRPQPRWCPGCPPHVPGAGLVGAVSDRDSKASLAGPAR